jgi:hypothetical protein
MVWRNRWVEQSVPPGPAGDQPGKEGEYKYVNRSWEVMPMENVLLWPSSDYREVSRPIDDKSLNYVSRENRAHNRDYEPAESGYRNEFEGDSVMGNIAR